MRVDACGCVWAGLRPVPSGWGDHSTGTLKSGLESCLLGCFPGLPPAHDCLGGLLPVPSGRPGEGCGQGRFCHCLRAPLRDVGLK